MTNFSAGSSDPDSDLERSTNVINACETHGQNTSLYFLQFHTRYWDYDNFKRWKKSEDLQKINFDFRRSLETIIKSCNNCNNQCFQEIHRKQAQNILDLWLVSFIFLMITMIYWIKIFCLGDTLRSACSSQSTAPGSLRVFRQPLQKIRYILDWFQYRGTLVFASSSQPEAPGSLRVFRQPC